MQKLVTGAPTIMSTWQDKQGRRHVGVMVGGKRLHRILPATASAGDAKQLDADLRSTLTALANATPAAVESDPLLTSIMPLYMAHADNLRWPEPAKLCARRIAPWLEGFRASQARTAAANIVRDMRKDYQAATINRSLAALKKALSLAFDDGLTAVNWGASVKSLPTHNKREMFLTVEQVSRLASAGSAAVEAAVWIALLTGCRRGEILKMRQEDIGHDTITIHSGNTKTLRTRVVPIVPALRPWLKAIPLPYKDYEGLKTSFQRARIKAEMPWVNFHDLRHSCASILMANGADIYTVSKILGHSTITTTQRYAHLEVSQQRAALKRAFG
jgi:integrase